MRIDFTALLATVQANAERVIIVALPLLYHDPKHQNRFIKDLATYMETNSKEGKPHNFKLRTER